MTELSDKAVTSLLHLPEVLDRGHRAALGGHHGTHQHGHVSVHRAEASPASPATKSRTQSKSKNLRIQSAVDPRTKNPKP